MSTAKLVPTQVNETTMGAVLFDGLRRRPALARDNKGKLVVCSPRTARKNGWSIEGRAFTRSAV